MDKDIGRALFYPKSIAVVGATNKPGRPGSWYVQNLISGGFKGRIYPINPKGGEIFGLKAYPNLKSVPEAIDYVIVSIAKELSIDVINDCAANGAKIVQFFTAGFREAGEEDGILLEEQMAARARQVGVRVLGPNCAGVACPDHNRAFGPGPFTLSSENGPVAFISHSSGLVGNVIETGSTRGIKFSKLGAFNNCCDLNELDFLDYVGTDPKTSVIGAYFEGTTNGRRLFELMRKVSKTKPLVIWKGGQTEAGAKAAASHTGSISGAVNTWEVAVKQSKALMVRNFEELLDTILAFQYVPAFKGERIAILAGVFTPGGGASVTFADECTSQGLKVPLFQQATRDKLKEMVGTAGTILKNPLDIGAMVKGNSWEVLAETLDVVSKDPNIDAIMISLWLSWFHASFDDEVMGKIFDCLADYRKSHSKPLIVVSRPVVTEDKRGTDIRTLAEAGIPTYDSVTRASRALAHVVEYNRNKR